MGDAIVRRARKITETVSLERFDPGAEDAHGNPAGGYEPAVDVGIWQFNPGGSQEPSIPGHARVITQPEIYFPGPQFGAHDRVTVRGVTYPVDGEQPAWVDDGFTGCVARLTLVEG